MSQDDEMLFHVSCEIMSVEVKIYVNAGECKLLYEIKKAMWQNRNGNVATKCMYSIDKK